MTDTIRDLSGAGGQPPSARHEPPEAGEAIGPYRVIRPLGRGGMGAVYLARHQETGAVHAVKVMLPELFGEDAVEAMSRFRREAEMLARVDAHPAVVRVHAVGQSDRGLPWCALEYVEGESLAERLRRGPLRPRGAARLVATLARGVERLHEFGTIHRDLKPANVLIGADGRARIVDFGLAFDLLDRRRLTITGEILGTPGYMAPEQIEGGAPSPSIDVWGLGALLYAALTGDAPFTGADAHAVMIDVCTRSPASPRARNPKVSPALEAACLKALAKAPVDRFASAADLADALERALAEPDGPIGSRGARVGWVAAAIAAVGLVVAAVVVVVVAASSGTRDAPSAASASASTAASGTAPRGATPIAPAPPAVSPPSPDPDEARPTRSPSELVSAFVVAVRADDDDGADEALRALVRHPDALPVLDLQVVAELQQRVNLGQFGAARGVVQLERALRIGAFLEIHGRSHLSEAHIDDAWDGVPLGMVESVADAESNLEPATRNPAVLVLASRIAEEVRNPGTSASREAARKRWIQAAEETGVSTRWFHVLLADAWYELKDGGDHHEERVRDHRRLAVEAERGLSDRWPIVGAFELEASAEALDDGAEEDPDAARAALALALDLLGRYEAAADAARSLEGGMVALDRPWIELLSEPLAAAIHELAKYFRDLDAPDCCGRDLVVDDASSGRAALPGESPIDEIFRRTLALFDWSWDNNGEARDVLKDAAEHHLEHGRIVDALRLREEWIARRRETRDDEELWQVIPWYLAVATLKMDADRTDEARRDLDAAAELARIHRRATGEGASLLEARATAFARARVQLVRSQLLSEDERSAALDEIVADLRAAGVATRGLLRTNPRHALSRLDATVDEALKAAIKAEKDDELLRDWKKQRRSARSFLEDIRDLTRED